MHSYNGLGPNMSNLSRLSNARSRSISAENFTGEKGGGALACEGTGKDCARDLGTGWKISPSIYVEGGSTVTIADIEGPGALEHIWLTPAGDPRLMIIRIYWDGGDAPCVQAPVGDFFAAPYSRFGYAQISSLAVCVNPKSGFNCYWEMPFRKRCVVTVENLAETRATLYYQIDYTLTDVPEDRAYFHAQFRRSNPLKYKEVHTILDGVRGSGHYVGTSMAWGVNNNGWWGEGEIKFYMDGDEHPTICGTGTEDYFCGSYNFDVGGKYQEFTSPYSGLSQVIRPDGLYSSQTRFAMYRWHVTDPIRFQSDLRVTIQALGWRGKSGRYLPLQDDIASVAYWYQTLPSAPQPPLPCRDELEII